MSANLNDPQVSLSMFVFLEKNTYLRRFSFLGLESLMTLLKAEKLSFKKFNFTSIFIYTMRISHVRRTNFQAFLKLCLK